MIFYGSKGKHIATENVNSIHCDYCKQQSTHTISIFGRYAHLYWIPLFPLSKKGVSECNHCKRTLAPKEMNEPLKMAYKNVKLSTKSPLWYWSGTALIVGLAIFGIKASKDHDKEMVHFIETPKKGDIVDYKIDGEYSTFKVTAVSSDSVYLVPNQYTINRETKLYKIDKPENYTDTPSALSLKQYKNYFDDKTFLDIERK